MPKKYRPSLNLARLAVFLGAIEFFFRALKRTNVDWLSDLAAPYTSAKLWLAGSDPYDPFLVLSTWYASGGRDLINSNYALGVPSVYPPPTLLLVSPLALLRWPGAVSVFMVLGLSLYAAVLYKMVRLGWPGHRRLADIANEPSALFFLAFALGLAPAHSAFHSLNIVLLAACAAILTVAVSIGPMGVTEVPGQARSARGSKPAPWIVAGVAASILFKPTTGLFLLPWLARDRRWRVIAGVIAICAVVTVVSLGPLVAHQGMAWVSDYHKSVDALFSHGGNADVSAENLENTDRIDLQLVAYAIFGDRTVAAAFAGLIYLVLLALFLGRAGWGKSTGVPSETGKAIDLPLLIAAGCLALGLLPSYTRVYSAIVVLPLALWCFTHLRFSSARWLLLLLADFLLNTSAGVRKLAERMGVTSHPHRLWDATIGGHTCWILLAVGVLLPLAIRQQIRGAEASPLSLPTTV